MHLINADLHCHSRHSDGTLSPADLAARARANGVELWALTDHDEISGLDEAARAARTQGLDFVTGVEISVTFIGVTVHIVGLGFDPDHAQLRQGLAATRGGCLQRAHEMADALAKVGHKGAFEGALAYVGNPDLISRTHFARWLVETGVCASTHEVFRHYLADGKPGHVPHRWAKLGDAVGWITGAGGIAVVAHPGRYRLTPNEEYALFSEFRQHGGLGVEVLTGSHGQADVLKYQELALEFDLLASRGSDFHSPAESRVDVGKLGEALSGRLQPVWTALEHRIHWPA